MTAVARGPSRRPKDFLLLVSLVAVATVLSSCSPSCSGGPVIGKDNRPPSATPASVTVDEDGSVGIRLAGTDSDGSVVGYGVATPPANGTLSGTAPDLVYAPAADYNGADAFTFTVTDDDGAVSAAAEVSIEVASVNDPPEALAQSVEVLGGESVDIVLGGTDIDGTVASYGIATDPAHGVLTGNAPDLTYAPDAGYAGADAFTFTVTDDEGAASAPAEVSIEVVAPPCAGDRGVLETFYTATGGDGWVRNEGWLEAEDLADWYGVDAAGLCVTAIRLNTNGLRGTLPRELGSLEKLGHLAVSGECPISSGDPVECTGNALTGEIPRELGDLASLRALDLRFNELSGPIPVELGNLANLEELRLYGNELSGPIPVELGNLANLEELRLYGNELSGPIPVELGNLANLEELRLYGNELSGPIPVELGNLANLEELRLYGNELSGPIPVELGNLANLRILSLSGNELSGPVPVELAMLGDLEWLSLRDNALTGPLPPELGDLADLRILDLSGNELTGEIPEELGRLTNATYVALEDNGLSGAIPVALGNLPLVRLGSQWDEFWEPVQESRRPGLLLGGNALSSTVPAEIGGLVTAEVLTLDGNRLTGQLPREMTSMTELATFRFDGNDGLCAPADDDFLAWLQAIATRDDGPVCNRPPTATPASVTVDEDGSVDIRLAGTDADGSVVGYRVATQPANGTLSGTAPDLAYAPAANYHGTDAFTFTVTDDDGAASAAAEVSIEVASVNDPPEALAQSVEVAEDGSVGIVLGGTDIDGTVAAYGIATEPAHGALTGTAPDLEYVPAADYNGTDAFTFTVTDDEGAVSAAAEVSIGVASVNDPPEALAQSVEVVGGESVDIVLGGTDIDGTVAAYGIATQPAHGVLTGNAPELTYAPDASYAGADAFTFTVTDDQGAVSAPAEVSIEVVSPCAGDRGVLETFYQATGGDGWVRNAGWLEAEDLADWYGVDAAGLCVTGIRLNSNGLRGTLPWELGSLGNLENLSVLDLRANELSGPIPAELGNLANLGNLRLSSNQLSGPIPFELGNLANLTLLSLSNNQLSGPIPVELGNLANLTLLSLAFNGLSGPIPFELGNLANLGFLTLEHNDLSGPIPVELGNLANLEDLRLFDNDLSGPLPVELGNLANLEYLYLDDNDLSGPIPVELGNLENLSVLDLRANELSGPIPVELGNLANLERLVLSDNDLSGPIPVEIGNLANLTVLALSDNALSGTVPAALGSLTAVVVLSLDHNRLTGRLPAAMTSMTELEDFGFGNNDGLCAPADDDFQAWLRGIPNLDGGPTCG